MGSRCIPPLLTTTSCLALLAVLACEPTHRFELPDALPAGPVQGHPLPEYRVLAATGDTVALADFAGQPVLINFWATWCLPCVKELPSLVRLHDELAPRGLRFVQVSIDWPPYHRAQEVLDSVGVTWLSLFDSDHHFESTFGWGPAVPKTLLVDRNGRTVVWWEGQLDAAAPRNRAYLEQSLRPPVGSH